MPSCFGKMAHQASLPVKLNFTRDGVQNGITWLVENKRPQDVHRFTGTLTHVPDSRDLQSLIVYAFTHYAFISSN